MKKKDIAYIVTKDVAIKVNVLNVVGFLIINNYENKSNNIK